jgi:hypothetical protein
MRHLVQQNFVQQVVRIYWKSAAFTVATGRMSKRTNLGECEGKFSREFDQTLCQEHLHGLFLGFELALPDPIHKPRAQLNLSGTPDIIGIVALPNPDPRIDRHRKGNLAF